MSAENKYEEMLEKVCNKLNKIDSVKEEDVSDIKNSVESIENLMTDAQAKLNFQEIKSKLEKIALQVDNCNDSLLKDLYNDLNTLKEKTGSVAENLENLQNAQNLALTSGEFEEYQKQQLDLALKTNENIFNELKALNEKTQTTSNPENIKNLENQLNTLHSTLKDYTEQLISKIEVIPGTEEINGIVSDYHSVNQKGIRQTNIYLKSLEARLEELAIDIKNNEFSKQINKISQIYDSLSMINAWIEKVGYINQAIENVYARLGENIDFDDVSDKIDIIYENITSLNNWTMKIDKVDESVIQVQSKLSDIDGFIEDTKNISETINFLKDKVGLLDSLNLNCDFEDLSNKLDIVYENLSAISMWANKIDNVSNIVESYSNKSEDISDKIKNMSDKIDGFNGMFEEESIFDKVDVVYENISLLNQWVGKIDDLTHKSEVLDEKHSEANDRLNFRIDEMTETLEKAVKIVEDVPNIKDKLEKISTEINTVTNNAKADADSYVHSLLDIEADFLKMHKFLDDSTKTTSNDINALKETTSNDIKALKERFSELNDDISSISIRTNKLILSADDANKEFKTYLDTFKQTIQELDTQRQEINPELRFTLLDEQINEVTKLMQESNNASRNLNNAFIYLADWVDATGNLLNTMQTDVSEIKNNNDDAIAIKIIQNDVEELIKLVQGIEQAYNDYKANDLSVLKEAVSYLITKIDEIDENNKNKDDDNNIAESIAKVSSISVSVEDEISHLKESFTELSDRINEFDNSFANFKTDDISEIKSSLTGIMVQLNTALTPDIDSLNERIDKLTEQQNNKMTELEALLQEKINLQEKQINNLEDKVDELTSKIDKLINVMGEDNQNDEIKDILNYLITQVSSMSENITNHQNVEQTINSIDEKVSSFDENINKIVSYIEEE
jgi:chromosome segregation ATPase